MKAFEVSQWGRGLFFWAAFTLFGCQGKSPQAQPPPADDGDDAGAFDAGDPCMQCTYAATSFGGQCETQTDACNDDMSCEAVATCLGTCALNDSSCITTCTENSAAATLAKYNAVGNCLCATSCASICGASCAGATDAGVDTGVPVIDSGKVQSDAEGAGDASGSCGSCEATATNTGAACSSQVEACDQNVSCVSLLNCISGCQGDATCAGQCQTTDQGGVADVQAINACVCMICTVSCASECGG